MCVYCMHACMYASMHMKNDQCTLGVYWYEPFNLSSKKHVHVCLSMRVCMRIHTKCFSSFNNIISNTVYLPHSAMYKTFLLGYYVVVYRYYKCSEKKIINKIIAAKHCQICEQLAIIWKILLRIQYR